MSNAHMNMSQALDELVGDSDLSGNYIHNIPSAPVIIEGEQPPDVFNPTALTVDIPAPVEHPPTNPIAWAEQIETDTDDDSETSDEAATGSSSNLTATLNRTNTTLRQFAELIGASTNEVDGNTIIADKRQCTICYNKFGIDKIVNTRCGHTYCNDCFFRWMKSNVTCAMCRKNFTSWRRHSQDQINEDITAVTNMFNTTLKAHVSLNKDNKDILTHTIALRNERSNIMDSLIRTRKLIDYNRGYAQGLLSTFRPKKTGSKEYDDGLMKGYEEFKDNVKDDRRKKRKSQQNYDFAKTTGKKRTSTFPAFQFHGNE
jgi:hypothetical protein